MKLPIPQRGQPFDVSLVYKIIESINSLWDRIAINVSAYAILWTSQGKKNIRNSEVKIVTGQYKLTNSTVKANEYQSFSYSFDIPFKLPPIVTVSPIATDSSDASKNTYAVITAVDTAKVQGFVKFELAGTSNMSVNIIAIGVPV
jgi:hypothetical protein